MTPSPSVPALVQLARQARQGCDSCGGKGLMPTVDELIIDAEICRCIEDPRRILWALRLVRDAERRERALAAAQTSFMPERREPRIVRVVVVALVGLAILLLAGGVR